MGDILLYILIGYFIGWQISYLLNIRLYMKENDIENMNIQEDNQHQMYGNQLFLSCMLYWWSDERRIDWLKDRLIRND